MPNGHVSSAANRIQLFIDAIRGPRIDTLLRFEKDGLVITRTSSIRGWLNQKKWENGVREEYGGWRELATWRDY